jgi:two-component system, response regulator PdtaR
MDGKTRGPTTDQTIGSGMSNSRTVLVVEDEAVVALFLTDVLEDLKHIVCTVASSGREALTLAAQHRPDLAMVDVRLKGDLNGVETAALLYDQLGIRSILLSGDPDALRAAQASRAAPIAVLSKPYTPEQLQSVLSQAFAPG